MTDSPDSTESNFWADTKSDVVLRQFQALVNVIDDGIYQLDSTGNFVAVNDSFVEITGYSRDRLLGAHVSLVLNETDVDHMNSVIQNHLQTSDWDPPTLEFAIETADREKILCELRFDLLLEDEIYQGTVGVLRDISTTAKRIKCEQKLTQYETIVETIEDGIYVLSEDSRFVVVNQAYVEMTGYSREELLGSHCSLVVGTDVSTEAAEQSMDLIETDEDATTIEANIVRSDGTKIPAESRFTPIISDNREFRGTVGVVRDVSERNGREQELQKYETIVETVEDGIYVLDENGHLTMVNQSFADMLGYSPKELEGAHAADVVDKVVHHTAKGIEEEIVQGNADNPSLEATVKTAAGDRIPAEATFAVLPSESKERERVGVVRDITERKEREQALEESEQRYRTLINHFPGAVGLYNEEFEYTVAGGELFESLEISHDEVVGSTIYERYPDDLVERIEPYFKAVFDGESNTFEEQFHSRDLWAHTLPVRNSDCDIFAGMLMVQDITERKEYQRKIEASNERLEQFAYAASHDLQEPLRMITSYLKLVDRRYGDKLDEDGREFIEFAVDGADRMQNMIEGLLNYSRVESQGDSFEPVDLDTVFENTVDDLQVKIAESNAEISSEPLPQVHGDAGQLRQVFQNLLSNAITYSGTEKPQMYVTSVMEDEEVIVSVRDEGVGINVDDQNRIFEVFQRLHSHEEYSGTGIGLALCDRIIERHGGNIWVESEPGEGSTFSFTLPTPTTPSER